MWKGEVEVEVNQIVEVNARVSLNSDRVATRDLNEGIGRLDCQFKSLKRMSEKSMCQIKLKY